MDGESTSGENFYSPNPPAEQVEQEQRNTEATRAALPFIELELEYFYQRLHETETIYNVDIGKGIHTDALILSKKTTAIDYKEVITRLEALRDSVTPQEAVS